ncbi:hypothetical protein FF38_00581 [Lucilia cuprina]|uniref:Uncharacterized protein n=1 Tax=Lucilia cuprina TaxID=7375 RepID=A0A0L0BQH9_LUCCU|nr:hypothetical protein FF38_00581 [Lucilia cuprina]
MNNAFPAGETGFIFSPHSLHTDIKCREAKTFFCITLFIFSLYGPLDDAENFILLDRRTAIYFFRIRRCRAKEIAVGFIGSELTVFNISHWSSYVSILRDVNRVRSRAGMAYFPMRNKKRTEDENSTTKYKNEEKKLSSVKIAQICRNKACYNKLPCFLFLMIS